MTGNFKVIWQGQTNLSCGNKCSKFNLRTSQVNYSKVNLN